ncbi:MAG: Rne/Rng family ribonuclease [Victivallaceae bacterium]|nr:Rne/Rng family ribonuclease [Victivallaceae bacterium]
MEKVPKQIILNCEKLETRFAVLSGSRLEEYQIERENHDPKVGAIYYGRIANLENSLQAAFVDIGAEKKAFLHYHDLIPGGDDMLEKKREEELESESIARAPKESAGKKLLSFFGKSERSTALKEREKNLRKVKLTPENIPEYFKPGTELLVQVVKSPIGTKGARVSTNLSIPGRYLVLLPYSETLGLSTRIENSAERTRLKKILASLEVPDGMGVICRTVGEGRKSIFFKRDLELLLDDWRKIEEAIEHRKAPCLVYDVPTLVERSIRDFMTDEIDCVMVDDDESYEKIYSELKRFGGRPMASTVKHYKGSTPIFDVMGINPQLDTVFNRVVKLPGGGHICIDETEALIAIDINSGRGRKAGDQPEFILQTNLEAAAEIARQLRLRNVGGLVVLDFIDMRSARDRDELYKEMKRLVKDDRAKTKVLPVSKLGLMEMTRQREHESILDTVYDNCPYCGGSGRVQSPFTVSVEIQRKLNSVLKEKRNKGVAVRVVMHPEVLARLKNEDANLLCDLEKKYSNVLSFRGDPTLHCEAFELFNADTGEAL